MSPEASLGSEQKVRALLASGNLPAAATLALRTYGPDVLRFLAMRLRSCSDAEDAFSEFCEDLWRGLAGFDWRCSLRTWMVTLARHAASRVLKSSYRRRELLAESSYPRFVELCEELRSTTPFFQRSEVQSRLRELRRSLRDDQQTLLLLRVDQALSWRELALVMGDAASSADEVELDRAAARVRARFVTIKAKLRQLAQAEGLLP